MSAATLSLIALAVAIIVSMVSEINVGLLSMALAFVVGTTKAGMAPAAIIKLFPADLFMLLLGVTFLFVLAQTNGTLERLTQWCLKLAGGNVAVVPFIFFALGVIISSIGPGAIPALALLAPTALAVAGEAQIPALLMGTMLIHGTIAGTMSPVAPMGVVVAKLVKPMVGDVAVRLYLNVLVANIIIAVAAYFLFGGLKLIARAREARKTSATLTKATTSAWAVKHWVTFLGIIVLLVAAIGFKWDVGLTALTIAVVIGFLDRQDEAKAIKNIPWGTILMVSGVMILIGIMGKTGGLDLIGKSVASFTNKYTAGPVLGFVAGLISIYSSTTGVVLPAFLPMVPTVATTVAGSTMTLISCLVLTANVVDASPLSTLGALVLASASADENKNKLFRNLMIWGISMAVVGTVVGFVLYVLLGL